MLFGCAVTQEGLGSSSGAAFGANHFHICLKDKNSKMEGDGLEGSKCNRKLLLIGRTTVLRLFIDKDARKFYEDYEKLGAMINPTGAPELSYKEFQKTYIGWTRLKFGGLPGVTGLYEDALVPETLREFIDFSSSIETVLFAGASDLVAARTNSDGFFIIERVLCNQERDFHACIKKYPKAIFDAKTGVQLDPFLEPLKGGLTVNLTTYQHR